MEEEDGAVAAEIAKNPEIISGELFWNCPNLKIGGYV